MPLIDLHCHTTASDGLSSPSELVELAATRAIDVIAVTDHDTVAGVAPAVEAGRNKGVRVVAGIEISTRHGGRGIHVLGFFVDPASPALLEAISEMRDQRRERARQMVERLRELGYGIEFDDVLAHARGDVIARPHVARALVDRGCIAQVRDAFTPELIGDRGRAYVSRQELEPREAIELVRQAGGVSVVAHPGATHHEGEEVRIPDELLAELAADGLAGIEVDHPDHSPLARERLVGLARDLDLVPTGGSDWHGAPEHTLGGWSTSEENFRRLEALAGRV